jgi:muramoyltetrapeptide carboxypeptidase
MTIFPKFLQAGDKVQIVGTGKCFEFDIVENAQKHLESWGLNVQFSENLLNYDHETYFSTSLQNKVSDLQSALDDEDTKAIFFARGGYGLMQIVDLLDFRKFVNTPKWLVGYSDVTAIQSHILAKYNIASIHGEMPLNYPIFPETNENLESLKQNLFCGNAELRLSNFNDSISPDVIAGKAIIGGNLSILCSLLGSKSLPNSQNKVLFIEDVAEAIFKIERMLISLKRAGFLQELCAIMLGSFTNISNTNPVFGKSLDEIFYEQLGTLNIPIFKIEAGHSSKNLSIVFG